MIDVEIKKLVDNVVKEREELLFRLFEKYGYDRRQIVWLAKQHRVCVYQKEKDFETTYYLYFVDEELVFTLEEKREFDPEHTTINIKCKEVPLLRSILPDLS